MDIVTDDPLPRVTHLDLHECWALLREAAVGRLALTGPDGPEIFPVNFVVDHGAVVIRTGPGSKLVSATRTTRVAFECDGYHAAAGQTWSVVAKGRLELLRSMQDVVDTVGLPLFPWHAEPKPFFLRLVPDELSGRRFLSVAPEHWAGPRTPGARSS